MIRLLLALLIVIPQAAFALDLTPPAGDLSVSYLSNIFGVVDGVLHGVGSQIVGTMFGVFNSAILTLGIIILTYIFFVSTINTAHEGEVLGKKWSSIWIPLRTVGGIALLLPKATGYSIIQIMVMWIVVQGVGAADAVWSTALNYMQRGGSIVEPSQNVVTAGGGNTTPIATYTPLKDNSWVVNYAAAILKSEICMFTLQNSLVLLNKTNPNTNPTPPDFAGNIQAVNNQGSPNIVYGTDQGANIFFPGAITDPSFSKYSGACGKVSWTFIPSEIQNMLGQVPGVPATTIANPAGLSAYDSESVAVRQMVLDLMPIAQTIANQIVPTSSNTPPQTPNFSNFTNSLQYAGADYITILMPALRQAQTGQVRLVTSFIDKAKSVGWILAGSYYFNLLLVNGVYRNIGVVQNSSVIQAQYPQSYNGVLSNAFGPTVTNNLNTWLPPAANVTIPCAFSDIFSQYACVEYQFLTAGAGSSQFNPNTPNLQVGGAGAGGSTTDGLGILNTFGNNFTGLQVQLMNIQLTTQDPIITVAQLGYALINWVEGTWTTVLSVIAVAYALLAAGAFFAGGVATVAAIALQSAMSWLLPILATCTIAALVTGSMLAYYVPMIPYILFLFGAIGWFSAVIEAMVAAPLVALGITHPEGHDLLGKGEQSMMLLAGVFLRPMLMVFGFILGVILSNVAIWLLNQGFSQAWAITAQFKDWFAGGIVYLIATFSIYMGIVVAVINRSFALIYEIPDTIMTWIGGPAQQKGGAQALEEVKGKLGRDVETGGGTMQKAVDSSATGMMQLGTAATKGVAGMSGGSGGGGGGAGGGGEGGGAPPMPPPV